MNPESPLAAPGCAFFSHAPESFFIPEDFSSDERMMIDAAENFSRKVVLPAAERLERKEEGLMPELIRQAGALGFCGVDSPEAYGGLGLGKALAIRILEFLSFDASFSVTIGVTSGISQVGLSWFGTEAQKARYLPKLTSGEWLGAYCLSEPNSGTDALSTATRADLVDGDWVLNGAKMWISNAKWAEFFLVLAKVGGERLSAFLVERDYPGIEISREEHKMGLHGSSTARVLLENAKVPRENLLYDEGKGHAVALNALNLGRLKLAGMSIGPARYAIELASRYAQERRQFNQEIAEFGLIRQKFAVMASLYFAAESMIYQTAALVDGAFEAWGGTIEGNRRAAEEFSVECSACKVFATEAEARIVDEALQIYGGYGYTEEFPIARIYRDARVSRIYEGTNEINRVFIAERLARRIREGRAKIESAGDSWISELAGKAMAVYVEGGREGPSAQIATGAMSDLILLTYAEQSTRLRARRLGGMAESIEHCFRIWAEPRAAEAYRLVTGRGVTIPDAHDLDCVALSDAVYARGGPL